MTIATSAHVELRWRGSQASLSERTACRLVGQLRGTQRYISTLKPDENELTRNIIFLASEYGHYGHRRMTAMLYDSGMVVVKDRVQLIWRRQGPGPKVRAAKVPQKQLRRSRLWLNDGSCIRLRPEHPNHVWSFEFVEAQTHESRRLRLITLIDEFSQKCLAIRVARSINAIGVIETLADAILFEGIPASLPQVLRPRDDRQSAEALAVRVWHQESLH